MSLRRLGTSLLLACGVLGAGATPQQTLVVAAFPAVDEIIRAALPAFKREHPEAQVRVLSRSFEDHHTVLVTALSTASNLPDVMVLEEGYIGRFAAGARLVDLSQEPYLIKQQQARFAPFAFSQATAPSGAVVAVPSDIGPGTLLYRVDVLKAAGVTEAELTQSWDSYIAAGVKIKAATGVSLLPHARNLAEIMMRAGIQPGDGQYFGANNQVLVESPRFVQAFEWALRLRKMNLDAGQTAWSAGWMDAIQHAKVATVMSGAWMQGHFANWVAPQGKGLWRAAQLPQASWNTWGGTFYTIPKGSKNKKLAWEFIRFMTMNAPVQLNAFKSQAAFPALLEAYQDEFFDQPIDYLGGQRARLLWREAAKHIAPVAVHELDLEARIVVSNELNKVLDQGKAIAPALHDARLTLERLLRSGAAQP